MIISIVIMMKTGLGMMRDNRDEISWRKAKVQKQVGRMARCTSTSGHIQNSQWPLMGMEIGTTLAKHHLMVCTNATPLLDISLHKCIHMWTQTYVHSHKIRNNSKVGWIITMGYIHTMELYSAWKESERLPHTTTWMCLTCNAEQKKADTQDSTCHVTPFTWNSWTCRPTCDVRNKDCKLLGDRASDWEGARAACCLASEVTLFFCPG